jgi:threonine/homoserine/homoserine lactone efflux protein
MLFSLIIKPFLFGLVAACSIGPMMLLILHRVSTQGPFSGIISALGLAISDGLIFALGMTGGLTLARQSAYLITKIEKLGGALLIFMGIKMLLTRNNIKMQSHKELKNCRYNIFWLFTSMMLLTIINPLTFIFFASASIKIFPELIAIKTSYGDVIIRSITLSCGSFCALTMIIFAASNIPEIFLSRLAAMTRILGGIGFFSTGIYLLLEVSAKI